MRILLAVNEPPLALLIEKTLTRFTYEWVKVDNGFDAFQKAITTKFDLLIIEYDLGRMNAVEVIRRCCSIENYRLPAVVVLTVNEIERRIIEGEHIPQVTVASRPIAMRKFVSMVQQALHQSVRIACLGGGTGLFTLLSGLKTLSGVQLSSIVSMSDDGGSTGKLRDIFGILPPGDVRRSLMALSTAPDLLNELMQYRFVRGAGLEGHNLGNLLITALHEMRGSMVEAVKSLGEILNIQGQVIPVTEIINTLHAELENKKVITGESRIGLFEEYDVHSPIKRLWHEPPTKANPEAIEALFNAEYIILGPGDLFTSIVTNLVVEGIREAICSSPAKKIYICNVMTRLGETTDFQVSDHVRELTKYLRKDVLDYVVCSSTEFPEDAIRLYAQKGQKPVRENHPENLSMFSKAQFIFEDVASGSELVRHDHLKLAGAIKKILDQRAGRKGAAGR